MTRPQPARIPEVTVTDGLVEATPAVVTRISQQLPEDFADLPPDQQINTVLNKLNAVRQGAPVGQVRRENATGDVAHRCRVDGVDRWHCTTSDGRFYTNEEPQLPQGWDVIYEPTAE